MKYRAQCEAELADRARFTQDYVTDIVRCDTCRFVFRHEQPTPESATATYEDDAYGADRLDALFRAQCELFRPRADRLADLLPSGKSPPLVIEIGSFVGGFLAAAQEKNWRILGIDPGREVTDFCIAKGLSVVCEAVTDAVIAPGSAAAVCIWNTFDQLPNPRSTVEQVTRWLQPGGVLAVRVPSGDCFHRCMRQLRSRPLLQAPLHIAMAWNNLLSFPYLHGHSIDTLDRLLQGFSLQRVGFHPSVLPRLADANTKAWAVLEEQCIKAIWSKIARRDGQRAPWFDAYYRAADSTRAVPHDPH